MCDGLAILVMTSVSMFLLAEEGKNSSHARADLPASPRPSAQRLGQNQIIGDASTPPEKGVKF